MDTCSLDSMVGQNFIHSRYTNHKMLSYEHREIDPEFCRFKPNLDWNYTFLIDLTPNGISFSAEWSGKEYLRFKFVIG